MASVDVYDEEFHNNLKIAKTLIDQVTSPTDKQICKKWLRKLCDLKSTDPVVKKNRNGFFKYMLSILHAGVQKAKEFPGFDGQFGGEETLPSCNCESNDFMSRWSADKRTYIACKPIPGKGTLVYLAVSNDPSLGWDHP